MEARRSAAPLGALVLAPLVLFAAPASATGGDARDPYHPLEMVHVYAGESIQEAIDGARAYTRITVHEGTYSEALVITKDGIELRGQGAVVLEPPAEGDDPSGCDGLEEPGAVSGICIAGAFEGEGEEAALVDPVEDVLVRGVEVRGASSHGLVGFGTERLRIDGSTFVDNGGYGAASFVTQGTHMLHNTATDNVEAGFYVGDSPMADAVVRDNASERNELGFLFRNASDGVASDNHAAGNCVGVVVLADAPGPAEDWEVADNHVVANNRFCEEVEAGGAGIALLGATDFDVVDNDVAGHAVVEGSFVSGGIVVRSGFGGSPPSGEVEDNDLMDNLPAGLSWDETGEVEFEDNDCDLSTPEGLCDD